MGKDFVSVDIRVQYENCGTEMQASGVSLFLVPVGHLCLESSLGCRTRARASLLSERVRTGLHFSIDVWISSQTGSGSLSNHGNVPACLSTDMGVILDTPFRGALQRAESLEKPCDFFNVAIPT